MPALSGLLRACLPLCSWTPSVIWHEAGLLLCSWDACGVGLRAGVRPCIFALQLDGPRGNKRAMALNEAFDFIVKLSNGSVVIVETKGLVDVDVPHKMQRLAQWITDLNTLQSDVSYDFAFVDEAGFSNQRPRTFAQLLQSFRDFKTVET